MPKISVVIPTLNEEKHIGTLLGSISKQTYKNYEIIVCDYKSTDKTRQISRKYGAKIINVKKKGFAVAKNEGTKKASGEIIAYIDADYELFSKDLFEKVVSVFQRRNKISMVEPRALVNRKDLPKNAILKMLLLNEFERFTHIFMGMLRLASPAGCVFCRGSFIKKIGKGFDDNLRIGEDTEFYMRLNRAGGLVLIPQTVKRSYRRFAREGVLKTYLMYTKVYLMVFVLKIKRYKRPLERLEST
jgi:hypothetical protein